MPLGFRAARVAALLAFVVFCLSACRRGRPSAGECTQMLDRYLDMTIAADPALANLPPAQEKIARDMKREVKKGDKSYRQVEEQCQREVSRSEYDCAMKAPTPNDWEACIE
ncbi:MAG TPA: hypothetical protein VGI39_37315 [Polyangiaceae bacterium]|jgi:hypothetical protein